MTMTIASRFADADLIYFTNFYVPLIRPRKARVVVTIRNMAPWVYPDAFDAGYLRFIKPIVSKAARTSDRIITVSQTVKSEIVGLLGVTSDKIDVCYNAVRPALKSSTLNIKKR